MSSLCSIVSDVMSDNPAVTSTTDCFLLSPRASACQLVMGIEPNPNRTRTLLIVEPNWTRTLYSAEQNRTSCRYCHFYFSNITCNRDDVGVGKHSTSVLSATRRSPDPNRPTRQVLTLSDQRGGQFYLQNWSTRTLSVGREEGRCLPTPWWHWLFYACEFC